jgi:hypothetical protein
MVPAAIRVMERGSISQAYMHNFVGRPVRECALVGFARRMRVLPPSGHLRNRVVIRGKYFVHRYGLVEGDFCSCESSNVICGRGTLNWDVGELRGEAPDAVHRQETWLS